MATASFGVYDLAFTVTSQTETTNPTDTYTAWATALGLSPTATMLTVATPFDDGAWDVAFGPNFQQFMGRCQISSEGGFGMFSANYIGGTPQAYVVIPNQIRNYLIGPSSVDANAVGNRYARPYLYVIARPVNADLQLTSVKFQTDNAGNAIFLVTYSQLSGGTVANTLTTAIRVYGFQKVLVVTQGGSAVTSGSVSVYTLPDLQQGFTEALPTGVIRSYLIENTNYAALVALPVPSFKTDARLPLTLQTNKLPPNPYGKTSVIHTLRVIAAIQPPPTVYSRRPNYTEKRSRSRLNWQFPGYGYISGDAKVKDSNTSLPKFSKIRLMRERDGLKVREMWSNATTGAWRFDDLEEDHTYTVMAYDPDGNFRAVLANKIVPIHVEPLVALPQNPLHFP